MSKRARLLSEIYDMTDNPKEIIVFTSVFKAKGRFLRDDSKRKEGLITLQDATVCNHFYDCTCDDCSCENADCQEGIQCYKWLNIIDKEVIAFSIIP